MLTTWVWVAGVAGFWCLAAALHAWSLNFLDGVQDRELPQRRWVEQGRLTDRRSQRAQGTRRSPGTILVLALLGGAFIGLAVYLWYAAEPAEAEQKEAAARELNGLTMSATKILVH